VVSTDGIYVKNGVSLGVAGNHTLTLGGTSSSTPLNTISGNISDGGGDRSLSIALAPGASNNSNRWTLSGNNTYTGTTTITNGALTIGHVNALGSTSAGTSVAAGAGLFFRGNVGTVAAEALTIAGNGPDNKGALRNVNGTNTWTGTIAATTPTGGGTTIGSDAGGLTLSSTADITTSSNGTLRFVGAAPLTVNGSISGTASVTNVAASGGTAVNGAAVIFGGDNKAYTGATTVTGGILRVNTGITATSAFNVGAGGILQGNGGTINTSISTVINGTGTGALGTISAGTGTGNIGAFTTGNLSLGEFSRMVADVNFDGTGSSDRINVSALTITSGAALEVNLLGVAPQIGTTVLVINNAGVWNNGLLSVGGSTVADDATFTTASGTYRLDYNYTGALGSGVAVTLLEVIPEPSTMGLLGFAMVAVGIRRRRA
jgi:autotransporter-associated beta strand protein